MEVGETMSGHPQGIPSGHGKDNFDVTDIREKGALKNGERQVLDRRLFMQLLVFGDVKDSENMIKELERDNITGALYNDINDPHGVGLLTISEDPQFFVTKLREFLDKEIFSSIRLKSEYTMTGRNYALGHEENLKDWLLDRPKRVTTDPEWPWAVWYPLRRKGAFSLLSQKEQMQILREHGMIGHEFGKADFARDIRLSCTGIDKNDNDFVIGLLGKKLYPLSALVQAMRKTKQTSTFIEKMGPFFIGYAIWQNSGS